ncbi:MAG: DUF1292 domain-containing protein [Clostridia bacterium]|nr:DUF1292 domain-containing protein [Clostridia bacterium]MBR2414702.1 DUF1292 domain-containing protein [Clostridia bacterium]MBR3954656.1 DUF1292 domain-containing protein [Clostridia bacterium]
MSNNKKQPEDENILVLHDEEGNKERYEIIDTVEYDNRDFIVLLPLPEVGEPNEEMLYVLEVVEDLDDPEYDNYIGIEDDETIDAVFEIFKEQYFKD